MKTKIPADVMEEIEDQAWQILYFESAMSNEDKAHKELKKRLVEIYKVGFENGSK